MNIPQLREEIEVVGAQIVALLVAVDRGAHVTSDRVWPEEPGARYFKPPGESSVAITEVTRLRVERVKLEAALGILVMACEKRDHEPQQVNGEWICSNCGAPCPQIGQDSAQEALSL